MRLFEWFGVLLIPAPAFLMDRRGVVTGMKDTGINEVTVHIGRIRLEPTPFDTRRSRHRAALGL